MNLLFLLTAISYFFNFSNPTIHDLTVTEKGGGERKLDVFRGKSLVITILNPFSPDTALVHYLEDLQKSTSSIQVIVVPMMELGGKEESKVKSSNYLNQISNNLIVTESLWCSKKFKEKQHALMSWLTSKEKNSHFDVDAYMQGQLFMVDGSGNLFGHLGGGTHISEIDRILKAKFKP